MELYLLRHGLAETTAQFPQKEQRRLELTPAGVRSVKRIAKAMRRLDLTFDLILSSPLLRARQTAEIVATELGAKKNMEFTPSLALGREPRRFIHELRKRQDHRRSVLVVGHEPFLSDLISLLLVGHTSLSVLMRKGSLCMLTVGHLKPGRCAILEWLLTPEQLEALR